MSALQWCAVALLGGGGAVARAVLARAAGDGERGILAVNVSGTLAVGIMSGAGANAELLLLAGTGFLGAYTTFSTWMHQAGEARRPAAALALPLAAGLAAVALGKLIGAGLA